MVKNLKASWLTETVGDVETVQSLPRRVFGRPDAQPHIHRHTHAYKHTHVHTQTHTHTQTTHTHTHTDTDWLYLRIYFDVSTNCRNLVRWCGFKLTDLPASCFTLQTRTITVVSEHAFVFLLHVVVASRSCSASSSSLK